jgi:hypothetical protein
MKRVVFKGQVYWLVDGDKLSPLSHFNEAGEFQPGAYHDGFVSYAVIEGQSILRYHQVIGQVSDLQDVIDIKAEKARA